MALTQVRKPETDSSILTYRISNLSDFIEFIEGLDEQAIIFREQREDWILLPKVARLDYYGCDGLEECEEKMLQRFSAVDAERSGGIQARTRRATDQDVSNNRRITKSWMILTS